MTYYPDLSDEAYTLGHPLPGRRNVGWLSIENTFSTGATSEAFRKRLTELCSAPILVARGYHRCEFCSRVYGNGEIHIESGNIVYAAPQLIWHYVEEHQYKPPEEFVVAVMNHGSKEA